MSSMDVNPRTTFTQVQQDMGLKWNNRDTEIRGNTTGTQLYVHNVLMPHGRGQDAVNARTAKEAQGGAMIRQAIDREYGPGWGDRVFQHINNNGGPDLNARVKRSDLATIQTTIGQLQTADNTTLTTGTVQQKLTLLANMPFDRTAANKLVEMANDPNLTGPQRDQAMTTLRNRMMTASPADREYVMKTATNATNTPLLDAMFALRQANGARAFSVADLSTITGEQFTRETPSQSTESFFRSNSVASALLGRGLSTLDNGRLTTLGTSVNAAIQAEVQSAFQTGTPSTIVAQNGQTVTNPVIINAALTRVDALFAQQNQQTPELHAFLGAVQQGVDNGNPPNPWTGTSFVKNAAILRGVNPVAINAASNQPPDPPKPQDNPDPTVNYNKRKETIAVTTGVAAAIQQVINKDAPFAQTSPHVALNPSVNAMILGTSGFKAMLGTVP